MDPSAEDLPKRNIVKRTNAINSNPPQVKNENTQRESSFASKAASIVLAGAALGGTAAVIEAAHSDGKQASAKDLAEPIVPNVDDVKLKSPEVANIPTFFDTVFHDLTPQQQHEARAWVDDLKERIKAKPGYEKEHLAIPNQYKEIIENAAKDYGLPMEMLFGIIAIENGGGTDKTNEISKARGVAQIMYETAVQYGLINKEKGTDHRGDPVQSIDVAGRYLRDNLPLLGNDIGLAIWAYHAGIGNVYNALRVYSLEEFDEDIGYYGGAIVSNDPIARESIEKKAKELIRSNKLDYFKLSSNPAVKAEVLDHLHDSSGDYVPAVLALLELEKERLSRVVDLGGGLKIGVPEKTFPSPLVQKQ